MHKTFAMGTITKKGSELRGDGDKRVLGFSVGVSNGKDSNGQWRDKTYYDCSIWGKRATALAPYLTAGTGVTVIGRTSAREYGGKAYLQLMVDEVSFTPSTAPSAPTGGGGGDTSSPPAGGGYGGGLDDEIPFAPEFRV